MVWINKKATQGIDPLVCAQHVQRWCQWLYGVLLCMCIINTLDKDPLNLLFYFKILYCFVHKITNQMARLSSKIWLGYVYHVVQNPKIWLAMSYSAPLHYLVCNFFLISGADKEQVQEGDNQVRLGRMLPLLQDISSFVTRAYEVVKNVIQQLASLHSKWDL